MNFKLELWQTLQTYPTPISPPPEFAATSQKLQVGLLLHEALPHLVEVLGLRVEGLPPPAG